MLRRDFSRVAVFRCTTFSIVVNFVFFNWYYEQDLVDKIYVISQLNCLHLVSYLLGDCHIIRYYCFCFFLTVSTWREPMSGPNILWGFLISVTLMEFFQHVVTYHALKIYSWWESHYVVCGSYLFYVPDLSICKAFFILFNSVHECDVMLLSVRFEVMIVYSPVFSPRNWICLWGVWTVKFSPCHHMWCCACVLPSHKIEYLITYFGEDIRLQYFLGLLPCCNGSRLHLSRHKWARLSLVCFQGERGCWTYTLCSYCQW